MEDKIDKYIEWVVNKIEFVQESAKSLQKSDVSIHDLKSILSDRLHVSLVLNSEYQRLKTKLLDLKREYSIFWDEHYVLVRRQLNPTTLSSGKWSSKSDIESEVRYQYKDRYLEFKTQIDDSESRIAFFKRLLTDWNSISFDVNGLIKLLEMEVYALSGAGGTETVRRRVRER